jgi:hypothetical protein
MAGREHLHHNDTPSALTILADLLDYRDRPPAGWEPTSEGAWVDWDALSRSYLSSTEVAAVHIARGCALAERHGGLPLPVVSSVRQAIEELTGGWTADPDNLPPSPEATEDAYAFADPVGLNPYEASLDPGDPDDDAGFEEFDGPAWRYILTAQRLLERHRRAVRPEPPDVGRGIDL